MKFCFNGCLILGTLDGANVEIAEEVGEENMFIFGAKVDEINDLRVKMSQTNPSDYVGPELRRVFSEIEKGTFGNKEELTELLNTVRNHNDFYLVCHDFYSYLEA
mmetsp:Transcript_18353/g.16000  ORF Transcript_18353/g.16000 Transcript_18353/m.16000 type:complete len:105 (+) Transcript_18353:2187-2501(+)